MGRGAKLAVVLVGFLVVVVAAFAWVAISAAVELVPAREILGGASGSLTPAQLERAQEGLISARDRLNGPVATALSVVPVVRQNLETMRATVDRSLPVVRAGSDLQLAVAELDEVELVTQGAIDLEQIAALRQPLSRQVESLDELAAALADHRSGWLLPPLWNLVNESLGKVRNASDSVESALEAIRISGPMLGSERARSYLVVLLNNAELRGGGGIPSGVGLVTANNGALRLGEFISTSKLRGDPPYERVEAPADFTRRFGRYDADTTQWVNATISPDLAEVADVVTRLYKVDRNAKPSGVIFIDPVGIQALMRPAVELEVPRADLEVRGDELADFVMSDAYAELGGNGPRREVLLELGRGAFSSLIEDGLGGLAGFRRAGAALAGGHIRVVSFAADEARALNDLSVSGALEDPSSDAVMVVAQNLGQDKLDYWMRRSIHHECEVGAEEATCVTTVVIRNQAPAGLTRYVAGSPYGISTSFVEIYVPETAEILAGGRDGEPQDVLVDQEDGYRALGFEFALERGEDTTLSISYRLPLDGGDYALRITPQPLAHDAAINLELSAAPGSLFTGAGAYSQESLALSRRLDDTLEIRLETGARTGIPKTWDALKRFIREPL